MGADASHAACRRTRKSTSGVIGRIGRHLVHASSSTQSTVRLSSGEAEYAALVRATAEGLYIRSVMVFFGHELWIALETDSTAAIGTVRRLGPGKRLRHVETELFFLQQLVKQGVVAVRKKDGKNHPPDLLTKHLAWSDLRRLLRMLEVEILTATGVSLLQGTGAEAKEMTAMATMKEKTARVGELLGRVSVCSSVLSITTI